MYSVFDRLKHIHRAPLKNLRFSFWWFRKTFFTKPRSETPYFVVDLDKPELEERLGSRYFEPGWELSYRYREEKLNLRRVEYVPDRRYDWWQVHVRGYERPDGGMELAPHFETEPSEHPDAHIDEYGLDVERGMDELRAVLEDLGIEHERREPSTGSTRRTAPASPR